MRLSNVPRLACAMLGGALLLAAAGDAAAHDALRVPLDSASVIRLKEDASIVIIGNPNIADVSIESPTLVFVFGIRPGETSLNIMNKDGESIYSVPVVVTPTDDRTITLDRNVFEFTYSCDPRCAQARTPGEDTVKPAKSVQSAAAVVGENPDDAAAAAAAAAEGGQLLLQPTAGAE